MTGVRHQYARFGRFNLVGLCGAGLQLLLFELLSKRSHLPDALAAALAVEFVVLHNFFWHEQFTWRDRGRPGFRPRALRLFRFHLTNGLLSIAGNALLVHCLVDQLNEPPLPSALAAIALCAPVNFLLADRWVYQTSTSA